VRGNFQLLTFAKLFLCYQIVPLVQIILRTLGIKMNHKGLGLNRHMQQ